MYRQSEHFVIEKRMSWIIRNETAYSDLIDFLTREQATTIIERAMNLAG